MTLFDHFGGFDVCRVDGVGCSVSESGETASVASVVRHYPKYTRILKRACSAAGTLKRHLKRAICVGVVMWGLPLWSCLYRVPTGRLCMVLLAHFMLKSVHTASEPCSEIVCE